MAHRKTERNPLFAGRWFEDDIILLCLRWYLRFKLSYRDLVAILAERGLSISHTTILRWVIRYAETCEKRWRRFERPVGGSWRVDETFIKVRGQWMYLYRAVDGQGNTVEFYLSRTAPEPQQVARKSVHLLDLQEAASDAHPERRLGHVLEDELLEHPSGPDRCVTALTQSRHGRETKLR